MIELHVFAYKPEVSNLVSNLFWDIFSQLVVLSRPVSTQICMSANKSLFNRFLLLYLYRVTLKNN